MPLEPEPGPAWPLEALLPPERPLPLEAQRGAGPAWPLEMSLQLQPAIPLESQRGLKLGLALPLALGLRLALPPEPGLRLGSTRQPESRLKLEPRLGRRRRPRRVEAIQQQPWRSISRVPL